MADYRVLHCFFVGTFNVLGHVYSLGHNICSINDPECVAGYANSEKGGDEELSQRGENPDFASSLCLPTPSLHWACFPEWSKLVSGGGPKG